MEETLEMIRAYVKGKDDWWIERHIQTYLEVQIKIEINICRDKTL